MSRSKSGPRVRSEGAYLLKRLTQSRAAIAKVCGGVSLPAVSQWTTGDTTPSPAARAALASEYGIPVSAWDTPSTEPQDAPTAPRGSPAEGFDIASRMAQLEASVERTLDELRTEKMTPAERAKVNRECASTLASLQKLKNEDPVTLKRIFSSKFWAAIEAAHLRALDAHPEAAAALARELKTVEDSEGS